MKTIAITMRYDFYESVGEFRDSVDVEWSAILHSAGFLGVPIPSKTDDVQNFLEEVGVDGLLLTGGGQPGAGDPRDVLEKKLLAEARKNAVPVFGVCRGFQQMNLFLGGQLSRSPGHVGEEHFVSGELFDGGSARVNSFHQNVMLESDLASDFQIVAQSDEHFVEAASHSVLPWFGIMWHPERPGNDAGAGPVLVADFFTRWLT